MKNINPKITLITLATLTTIISTTLLQGCGSMTAPLLGNIISRTTGLHHSSENEPDNAGLARQELEIEQEPTLKQEPKPKLGLKKEPEQELKQETNLEQ